MTMECAGGLEILFLNLTFLNNELGSLLLVLES